MEIFIFSFLFFISPFSSISMKSGDFSIKNKDMFNLDKDCKNNTGMEKNNIGINIYNPTYQDYKFWTEENRFKKVLLDTDSFSIEKYYSHNFFKHDNFGLFHNIGNGKNLLIPNNFFLQRNSYYFQKISFFEDPFFYREKIQYFDVKTPLSEIFYENNFSQERGLGGFFSHNLNEKINYSIEYRNVKFQKDEIDFQKNQELLLTTFNYQDQKDDFYYKLWGHYIKQNFLFKEKEEIIKWKNIKNYKNVFFDFFDQKKINYNRFYISFLQKIFPKETFFFKNYIEYEKYSKSHCFSEQKNKINFFYLKNGFFFLFKKNEFDIEIGSIFDRIDYELFSNKYYSNNRIVPKKKHINNFSIEAQINYPISNTFIFHSFSKWMVEFNNLKKPLFHINMELNTFLFPKFHFITQFYITENKKLSPNFIHLYTLKENNDCYNNRRKNMPFFDKERTIDFSFSYMKNYNISFYVSKLGHLFLDEKKEMETFLYRKFIKSYGLKIGTKNKIWKFQISNLFFYQKYDSNPLIFSIPTFLSRNTISYQDRYFNKSLLMETGFSLHYFNNFSYQRIYYPFDNYIFSSEKECYPNKTGRHLFMDYFFNFKLNRITFYFGIQNINCKKFFNEESFIRTGLLWTFFT
ncbi:putative porin [Blattabacterium cuenoti]|uniref:putative porin n=1 Tax=Blattabacterium cuenoti TaxID=1653831 RepID=UPI00163B9FF5|nr:putative porin [Blattabacterium cuenoti]